MCMFFLKMQSVAIFYEAPCGGLMPPFVNLIRGLFIDLLLSNMHRNIISLLQTR
jgi:hypothetical protein